MYQVLALKCWIKCMVLPHTELYDLMWADSKQHHLSGNSICHKLCDGNCVQSACIAFLVWLGWEGFPRKRCLNYDPKHESEVVCGGFRMPHPEEAFWPRSVPLTSSNLSRERDRCSLLFPGSQSHPTVCSWAAIHCPTKAFAHAGPPCIAGWVVPTCGVT